MGKDPKKAETVTSDKPSAKARALAARLAAVQAVYQARHTGQDYADVLEEYLNFRSEMEIEGEALVKPDGVLLTKILRGLAEREDDLNGVLAASHKAANKGMEPLLYAIVLCAAFEILQNTKVDAPILINDYLNITHAFYEAGEAGLVNGMLDSVARVLRD